MTTAVTQYTRHRPILLGVYAQLGAFGCSLLVTAVYATGLAVRARGTPSQALINAFATRSSPWIMAVAGIALTFLLGRRAAQEAGERRVAATLLLGVTSALVSMVPALVLHGRPGLRTLLIAAGVVLMSWIGGALGARPAAQSFPPS